MINRLVPALTAIAGAIVAMLLNADDAWAEKRVALVVGNSSYQTVPQLPNPSRDANSVAKMFRDAGFEKVDIVLDAGNLDFKRSIRKFQDEADHADIAVIYYAGHGIEISGTNYLIPTDARLASDRDAEDEAIPLERLVSSADGAKKLRVVILDACRDNPFTVKMRRERRTASRAVSTGLGKVEPTSTDTLIAYAAKAGSTAEDGSGEHSPFTTALLKNLTIPGLDIRLAFGRIRDEVLKITGSRQEPFVYGSLGGGNISLVPAPAETKEAPSSAADIKADYDLVAKIGSKRAWEVFLGTYKTGFYADLARAQLASLAEKDAAGGAARAPSGAVAVPEVDDKTMAPGREPSARETADWNKVKDSTSPAAFERFIRRHPDSPLAITAQQRLDILKQAAQEREEKERAERERARAERERERAEREAAQEAARKAAEEARLEAERKKAEALAARKREEEERRAKALEAAEKAKALEAERKAAEAKQKAEEAEKAKEAARAAALRAESERRAKAAEEARKKAEAAAALEAACKEQQGKLEAIITRGSDGSGIDDLKAFQKTITCDRIKPQAIATLETFNAEAAKRAAAQPNSPELVRAAQTQLARVGCTTDKPDGVLGPDTRGALTRYLTAKGEKPGDDTAITEAVVAGLSKESGRVCALECKADETAKGGVCVANAKPEEPATETKSAKGSRHERHKSVTRERARPAAQASRPAPRARQQATSRPSSGYGGGGGGGGRAHTMIGVGF